MGGFTAVLGLGEVGRPLLEIISEHHDAVGIDLHPAEVDGPCDVLHVCYPYEIDDFIGQTVANIGKYRPTLTVINSTVSPGTTRAIYDATGTPIVHSPVRGKHLRMRQELLHYPKFIGPIDKVSGVKAVEHFRSVGMDTVLLSAPEVTELAKLTETTYFAVMIAWAQEVERYCDRLLLDYDEVVSFYEGIEFFPPVKYFPGVIGGHCLMPNLAILKSFQDGAMLRMVEDSNEQKKAREMREVKNP